MPALITERGRRPAILAAVAGAVLAVALAAVVWHGTTTRPDSWVIRWSLADFGGLRSDRRRWWLLFSEPAISLTVPGVVAVWAALTRRVRLAVFAVVAPLLALGVTELVGKPLVDRVIGPFVALGGPYRLAFSVSGSYPSGHETGTVAWLVVVVVATWQLSPAPRARVAVTGGAVLWALAAAFGLTINYYHYATDTIGAIGSTVAVVLVVALALDRWGDAVGRRVSSPAARSRSRTTRGA